MVSFAWKSSEEDLVGFERLLVWTHNNKQQQTTSTTRQQEQRCIPSIGGVLSSHVTGAITSPNCTTTPPPPRCIVYSHVRTWIVNCSGCTLVFLEDRVETLEAVCADSKLEVSTRRNAVYPRYCSKSVCLPYVRRRYCVREVHRFILRHRKMPPRCTW